MKYQRCLITGALMVAAVSAGAQTAEMLDPAIDDLRPADLVSADQVRAATSLNRATRTVRFSRAVSDSGSDAPAPYTAESRQYWHDTDTDVLRDGLTLPLSAPGAVIRISPLADSTLPALSVKSLELVLDGKPLDPRRDLDQIADGRALREAGLSVTPGSVAFRLHADAGAGDLRIRLTDHYRSMQSEPLVVHVFEPRSTVIARVTLPRQDFLAGETLRLDLALENGDRALEPDSVQAVITDPSAGNAWPLSLAADGRSLQGTLPAGEAGHPAGLWEARVYVEGEHEGLRVRRDIPVAFGVTLATARLDGSASVIAGGGLDIGLGVDVAQAGRYQVSGTLYGTSGDGQPVPVARAETAAWLDAGTGQLSLAFDDLPEGISGPLELRGLRLADQGRMGLLEYRGRAVTIRLD